MPNVMMNQVMNIVDDNESCRGPFVFALNIEGDHEGGFASRVIQEIGIEKFGKTGAMPYGKVVVGKDDKGWEWIGIACYSLGYEGWDRAKDALLEGLQFYYQKQGWDQVEWERQPYVSVQLPGGDKVGKMQGADPFETMAAFAEFAVGKFIIYNG